MIGNLQHRLFPSFALLAVALVSDYLSQVIARFPKTGMWRLVVGSMFFLLVSFSLIKATNEASLVNWWTFYTPPEMKAMVWFNHNMEEKSLWAGFSGRLPEAFRLVMASPAVNNSVYSLDTSGSRKYFLISDMVEQQSARILQELPDQLNAEQIYDNGNTKIYHRRPSSPYQR